MQKYNVRIFFSFVLFFCCIELLGMEQSFDQKKVAVVLSASNLPSDMTSTIFLYCDIQSIVRFCSTGQYYNNYYKQHIICQTPNQDNCTTFGCSFFKKNFDACTKILSHYAEKYYYTKKYQEKCNYIKNDSEINNYLCRFKHLWNYDHQFRDKGIIEISGIKNPTWEDRIKVYAGDGSNLELMNTIQSLRLKKFLNEKEIAAAKTILLDERACVKNFITLNDDVSLLKDYIQSKSINENVFWDYLSLDKNDVIQKLIYANGTEASEYELCIAITLVMKKGNNSLVNRFITYYSDICYKYFFRLLYIALKYNCGIEEIQLLVKNRHVDDLFTNYYCDAVKIAIKKRNDIWMRLIKDYERLSSTFKFDLFYIGLKHNYPIKIVELLFLDDINVIAKDGKSLLYIAIKKAHVPLIEFLLLKGIDKKLRYNGNKDAILKMIFTKDKKLIYSRVEVIEILFNNNMNDIDTCGRTLLMQLFEFYPRLSKLVCSLIDFDDKISVVDKSGKTILHYYSTNNFDNVFDDANDSILSKLIKKINVNSIDNEGKTALHYACNQLTAQKLLKVGADINARDNEGETLFLLCARKFKENKDIINFLLDNNTNVSIVNNDKKNFFHIVCNYDECDEFFYNQNIFEKVLKAGANINAYDINNNTPLMIAYKNKDYFWIEKLKKLGAIDYSAEVPSALTNNQKLELNNQILEPKNEKLKKSRSYCPLFIKRFLYWYKHSKTITLLHSMLILEICVLGYVLLYF